MTRVGQCYSGIWPERPVPNAKPGDVVRYPIYGGRIKRGEIEAISSSAVLFTNSDWCFLSEISDDKD